MKRLYIIVILISGLVISACCFCVGAFMVRPDYENNSFLEIKYEPQSEIQGIFYELIEDNPIDRAYRSEENDGTTLDMRKYQKKFIDIWQDELDYSCESFAKLLNDTDRKRFLENEEKWESNLQEEFLLVSEIINNSEYGLVVGSNFPLERNVELMYKIRERTLYIKYLQFYMEFSGEFGDKAKVTFKYNRTEIALN